MANATRREKASKIDPAKGNRVERPGPDERDGWDGVDESVLESFPASDAPIGWAGRDIAPPPAEPATKP